MAPRKASVTAPQKGRRRKTSGIMTQISISVPSELVGVIDKYAREQARNRSNYISWIMHKVVEGKVIILADGKAEDYDLVRKS